jgi:hypothetical protein
VIAVTWNAGIAVGERVVAGVVAKRAFDELLAWVDVPSMTISALAGTSRSIVRHFTSSMPPPLRNPAKSSSSTLGGSGAVAA